MLTLTMFLSQTTSPSKHLYQTTSPSKHLHQITTCACPFPLAHLADPSNELTELRADRNFDYVKKAQDVCKAGEKLNLKSFWRQVNWCIRYKGISIRGLTEAAHKEADQRKRRNGASKKQKHIIGGLIAGLFKDSGSRYDFRDALAIHTKTGNVNDVINLIRSRLSVPGLGFNLVPSICTVATSNAKFTQHFIKLCNPERTFSGFRVDVVRCVKLAAYAILQTTNVSGLKVDIWGDGAVIGGTK